MIEPEFIRLLKQTLNPIHTNTKHTQQQKKESKKEALFIESRKSISAIEYDENQQSSDESTTGNDTDLTNGTDGGRNADEDTGDDEHEYYRSYSQTHAQIRRQNKEKNKSKHHRLSSIRNSLRSIIPSKKKKKKDKKKYDSVHSHEHSMSYNNDKRMVYEPFEYSTDTMIIHKSNNSDPLAVNVKTELMTTDTDDDNISIATYGTTKDCLDDDLESELNALNASSIMDTSFISDAHTNMSNNNDNSPPKSIKSSKSHHSHSQRSHRSSRDNKHRGVQIYPNNNISSSDTDAVLSTDNEDKEKSVSLSLESISNSLDEDEKSPPPPVILKKGNLNQLKYHRNGNNINKQRKNSVPLAQIKEVSNDYSNNDTQSDGDCFASTDNNMSDTTSADDLDDEDVNITIDDISCDEMMTASML